MEKEQEQTALSFEEAVKELEEIVAALEAGDVPLERSLELFKRGVVLTAHCNAKLSEAQGVVRLLTREAAGELKEIPFADGEEEPR